MIQMGLEGLKEINNNISNGICQQLIKRRTWVKEDKIHAIIAVLNVIVIPVITIAVLTILILDSSVLCW